VKIYVAAVEALRKMMVSWVSPPPWMLMYFFAGFFFNLTLCMTKLRVLVLSFLTLRISLLCKGNIYKCKVKLMGVEHSQNKRLGRGGNLGGGVNHSQYYVMPWHDSTKETLLKFFRSSLLLG
jgi:hypothetical protein